MIMAMQRGRLYEDEHDDADIPQDSLYEKGENPNEQRPLWQRRMELMNFFRVVAPKRKAAQELVEAEAAVAAKAKEEKCAADEAKQQKKDDAVAKKVWKNAARVALIAEAKVAKAARQSAPRGKGTVVAKPPTHVEGNHHAAARGLLEFGRRRNGFARENANPVEFAATAERRVHPRQRTRIAILITSEGGGYG